MPNFNIVPISQEYVVGYWQALSQVIAEGKYLSFLQAPSLEKSQEFVNISLQGNWPHFVAIVNHQVVGWCDISPSEKEICKHSGALGIGVIAFFRGQDIGTALIKAAINKAQNQGLTRIELTVRQQNTSAIKLYEKLGFKHEGIHVNAIKVNNQYQNYLSMALLLD